MTVSFINLVRIKEIRTKILITLGLLLCYRVGFYIPLPGIKVDAALGSGRDQGLFGLMSVLTGSNLSSAVIFSLGVMPYISASIIFSLLTKVVPSLEKLSKEGASGQRKINQYTRLATVPICLLQSMMVVFGTIAPSMGSANPENRLLVQSVYDNWWGAYILVAMVAMTTGTLFIMWLGEQITEHGVGNGISLIIMAGIISGLYPAFNNAFTEGLTVEAWQTLLMFFGAWGLAVVAVVFMTKAQRRIPIQQAKQTRGRRVYGGQRHFLPLKVNQAGVMPIIFASALLLVPSFIGKAVGWEGLDVAFSTGRGFWYVLTYAGLIFFFAFFWTSLMFQPQDIANNLKEHGSFIPGIRPGKNTAEFLETTMLRITLAGASFLVVVAVLPNIVSGTMTGVDTVLLYFMSGTSILIVVGVALDLVEKLNALLIMRNYEGFMKEGGTAGGQGGWGRRRTT